MRHLARASVFLAVLAIAFGSGYLALVPPPIRTVAWTPPAAPAFAGATSPNERLREAVKVVDGGLAGPESVAIDAQGRVYTGTADGSILRATPSATGPYTVETIARTGGRPLGIRVAPDGGLFVADARVGLVRVDAKGNVTALATEAGGRAIRFADDLDLARDGTVFFTDASDRFTIGEELYDVVSGEPSGRLLAWNPATRRTRVVVSGLYFANGVALAPDESYALVCETARYRIQRVWLAGPKAGHHEVLAENLPGFPDSIRRASQGGYWVACFTKRKAVLDRWLHPRAWLKTQLVKLPTRLWPRPDRYGLVIRIDDDGTIVESLHDPGGRHVSIITSADEVGGALYLGTLTGDWLGRLPLGGPTR